LTYSITEENYLKAIFANGGNGQIISTNTLAAAIHIKASSVTDMLKKLKSKKLILYKPYEGCKLTVLGEKVALMLIRKHRIWETFLYQTLGFSWEEVHFIAEELEHIKSDQLINRLDAFLGFPKTDPHGDIIPDVNGNWKNNNATPLNETAIGVVCNVHRVRSHEIGLLEMLNHYKIKIGTSIEIIAKFAYDESIEVRLNGKENIVLSKTIAKNILVI
jgi:DtxR family transcriptional regulator, Mn-dependent transcriptional regulator